MILFCADLFVFHYHTVKCVYLEEFTRLMNCCADQYISVNVYQYIFARIIERRTNDIIYFYILYI